MAAIEEEFATVDLIVRSKSNTRGVDAFVLTLIKAERQVRRLFTHLVYQFPVFGRDSVEALRDTLAQNRRVYFEGVLRGFDALYPRSIQDLVGGEYQRLRRRLREANEHRNKIFHGQLTRRGVNREDLLHLVTDIRSWCTVLSTRAEAEFGYDGFRRNSFQKAKRSVSKGYKVQLTTIADYKRFIHDNME